MYSCLLFRSFHYFQADWISADILEPFKKVSRSLQNNSGEVVIFSMVHRTQERNLSEALKKLHSLLKDAEDISLVRFLLNYLCLFLSQYLLGKGDSRGS